MTFKRKMLILDEQDMEKLVFALDLAAATESNIAKNYKELMKPFGPDRECWQIASREEQIARERAEDYKRLADLARNAEVAVTVVEL